MGEEVFAVRKPILDAPYIVDTYMPELHRVLLPSNLKAMTSLYLTSAHDSLLSMIASMNGASGPLKTFVIPPSYRAACHAGFGPNFPAEQSYPLFKTFDDNFHLLVAGLPNFYLSKTKKAWHDLVNLVEAYVVKADRAGDDLSPYLTVALDAHRRGEWVRAAGGPFIWRNADSFRIATDVPRCRHGVSLSTMGTSGELYLHRLLAHSHSSPARRRSRSYHLGT